MIYQISSGQGPVECELGVAKFLEYLQNNYSVSIIDKTIGYYSDVYKSVRIYSDDNLDKYVGSVQWVCQSTYRPNHKRKNWFIDFSKCPVVEVSEFDLTKVVFDTFRSGGKGGQNVNKVESGVRAIYVPTGQAVTCTDERSQYMNKQKAISRLRDIINKDIQDRKNECKDKNWKCHNRLERGNASTKFCGLEFIKQ